MRAYKLFWRASIVGTLNTAISRYTCVLTFGTFEKLAAALAHNAACHHIGYFSHIYNFI